LFTRTKDGETYANIAACTPDKSGSSLTPSGNFVRGKDRNSSTESRSTENGGGYRRTEQPRSEDGGRTSEVIDHGAVKVHVGKYKGIELRDLNLEAVQALCEKWLPGAKANAKPTADDKRLIAALDWWLSTQEKANDNLEF
jgi:hypothetical protein